MQSPPMSYAVISSTSARTAASTYEATAASHPALCEHPTLPSVVAFLETRGHRCQPTRSSVLRALVTLAQRTPEPVWSMLLLVAYAPFVEALVAEAGTDTDDREGRVVECFLGAVAEARANASSITLEIHARTRKALEARALADEEWSRVLLCPDMSVFAAPEIPRSPFAPMSLGRTDDASATFSDEHLLHTFAEHGSLGDLVRAHYGTASQKEQRKAYAKLAQRRAKLAKQLRNERRTA